jgi:hypothetical protein
MQYAHGPCGAFPICRTIATRLVIAAFVDRSSTRWTAVITEASLQAKSPSGIQCCFASDVREPLGKATKHVSNRYVQYSKGLRYL